MSTEETTVDGVPSDEWPEELVRFADADLRNLDEARAEAETLRQELDDTKADLARMVGLEAEARRKWLTACERRDTWRTMHHEVEAERDHLRAHGFIEDYIHGLRDDLADAEQQLGHRTTELDALRTQALRVVQLYRLGNEMATVVAVDRLGEVLDGGT